MIWCFIEEILMKEIIKKEELNKRVIHNSLYYLSFMNLDFILDKISQINIKCRGLEMSV
jgi:hypothetical protein